MEMEKIPATRAMEWSIEFEKGIRLRKPEKSPFQRTYAAQIQEALQRATFDSNSQVGAIFQVLQTRELPPTYFRTNKLTSSFLEIVDAYGVAKYQEANTTVFTIVTFPFLFAVMFGDWGHGICLLLATSILIFREKKLGSQKLGDIMEMVFGGRCHLVDVIILNLHRFDLQ